MFKIKNTLQVWVKRLINFNFILLMFLGVLLFKLIPYFEHWFNIHFGEFFNKP